MVCTYIVGECVHGQAGPACEGVVEAARREDEQTPLLAEGEIAGGRFVTLVHRRIGDEDGSAPEGLAFSADGFFGGRDL